MNPFQITLPDGSKKTYSQTVTPGLIAKEIGKRLEQDAVAASVDGILVDLSKALNHDAAISIVTHSSPAGLEILRHSTAHVLAQALKELFPGTQIAIGPTIDDGFYYDIDCPKQLSPEDLPSIESRMQEIVGRKLDVNRRELSKPAAIELFRNLGERFKVEIIEEIPEEKVSVYTQGDFTDLCRGPHVPNTERLGKFKLLTVAGAYWRGNENNPMLQRIYGTAWPTQKELDAYLAQVEEAKKRDHRKLGPELGLFTFLPVAPAMPFYLPKGALLFNMLTDYMRAETAKMGYEEVICPQIMTGALWQQSGHMDYYRENMFIIEQPDHSVLVAKPMNCPGHVVLYASARHSYRELPVRYAEYSKLHRNERAGVTHGLFRTRAFCQDDGHIFCMPDQIMAESYSVIQHTYRVYRTFGFENIAVKLATRPPKFMGTAENFDKATQALEESLKMAGLAFEWAAGEGAFYGPKIEFHVRDSLGRFWQCGTIQVDFNLPERFGIEYVDSQSKSQRPVMIHRAVLGSLERFMGILIEHHGGHLPLWISPTQVVVMNVTSEQCEYAQKVTEVVKGWGIRAELDNRNEKLNYKIREAQLQKIPLMLILGSKEVSGQTVSVRTRTGQNHPDMTLERLREFLEPQLKPKEG